MLRVDHERWRQDPEELRFLAQEALHPRTRERLMALYEITQGKNATEVARQYNRDNETVHKWVHQYNQGGPEVLVFKRSGGRPPFAHRSRRRWASNSKRRSGRPPSRL